MISIINKANADFDGNDELTYSVPEDTACLVIRPKGGDLYLIPSLESAVIWTIDENEKFEIRTRDLSNKSLVMRKENGQTVNVEILRYSGVLA